MESEARVRGRDGGGVRDRIRDRVRVRGWVRVRVWVWCVART